MRHRDRRLHTGRKGGTAGAAVAVLFVLLAGSARAASVVLAPGQPLTLTADLELGPDDNLIAEGTPQARCTIVGAQHQIRTAAEWHGRISLRYCDVSDLGTSTLDALTVQANGVAGGPTPDVTLESNIFQRSGTIFLTLGGTTTAKLIGNTIAANSVVQMKADSRENSHPAIWLRGDSTASKLFQSNRIFFSFLQIETAGAWLVGGDTPAQGNLLIGTRAGMFIDRSHDIVVRGNYISPALPFDKWNQLEAFEAGNLSTNLLAEHNVFRGANYLSRNFSGGELRYNLLVDGFANTVLETSSADPTLIHHNLFVRTQPPEAALMAYAPTIVGVGGSRTGEAHTQIFNNTFDLGGPCRSKVEVPIGLGDAAVIMSLRNNAIVNAVSSLAPEDAAVVRSLRDPTTNAFPPKQPVPNGVQYADYNLFFNPALPDNYAVAAAGLVERTSPGFAANDVPVGGPPNQQVDPQFAGTPPVKFPFTDEQVKTGAVTICEILAYYRALYTPRPGSPLVGAGDPADGLGQFIGAVGLDSGRSDDLFGLFCPGVVVPTTLGVPDAQVCAMGADGGVGQGGTGGTTAVTPGPGPASPNPGSGVVCVCSSPGRPVSPRGGAATIAGSGLLIAFAARRRRAANQERRRALAEQPSDPNPGV